MDRQKVGLIFLCVLVLSLFWATSTGAQEQNGWSSPYRLSSASGQVEPGSIIADQYGYVHAFWVEQSVDNNHGIIQYARFDGETWSEPNDIQVASITARVVSSAVDQEGNLHIVWSDGNTGPVYYSRALAYDALSAQNWSPPYRLDIPAYRVKLQVDSNNIFHILYTKFYGQNLGVYYVRSEDQGSTWTEPYRLDPDIPFSQVPDRLQLKLDESNGLHALWNYVEDETGAGTWVRYSHSLDGGDNWSLPFTIDEDENHNGEVRAPGPLLAIQGQTVHVIWGGTNSVEREHRFSTDRGQNWSTTNRILGNLAGQGGDDTVVDAAGRIHFLGQIRYPQAIWHTYWDRDHWTTPSMVYLIASSAKDEIGHRIHAHSIRLAVRRGNQLVVIFTNSPSDPQRILYTMHRTLDDVAPLSVVPTPIVTPPPTPTSIANSQEVPVEEPTPTPTVISFDTGTVSLPAEASTNPGVALGLGLAPVLLLISGIIIFQFLQKR